MVCLSASRFTLYSSAALRSLRHCSTVPRSWKNAITPGISGSQNVNARKTSTATTASPASTPNAANAPIMPPSTPPTPPGIGSRLPSMPTKKAWISTASGGGVAERAGTPPTARRSGTPRTAIAPSSAGIARAQVADARRACRRRSAAGTVRQLLRRSGRPCRCAGEAVQAALRGRSGRAAIEAVSAIRIERDHRRDDGHRERRLAGEDARAAGRSRRRSPRAAYGEVGQHEERDRLVGHHRAARMPGLAQRPGLQHEPAGAAGREDPRRGQRRPS